MFVWLYACMAVHMYMHIYMYPYMWSHPGGDPPQLRFPNCSSAALRICFLLGPETIGIYNGFCISKSLSLFLLLVVCVNHPKPKPESASALRIYRLFVDSCLSQIRKTQEISTVSA